MYQYASTSFESMHDATNNTQILNFQLRTQSQTYSKQQMCIFYLTMSEVSTWVCDIFDSSKVNRKLDVI